jgi:hypothetical protein
MTIENIKNDIINRTTQNGNQWICDWHGKIHQGESLEDVINIILDKHGLLSMPKGKVDSGAIRSIIKNGRRNGRRNSHSKNTLR